MITPQSGAVAALAGRAGFDADLGRMRTRLLEGGATSWSRSRSPATARFCRCPASQHPFVRYRQFGVPVALVTDDEGIERTDLTHEYEQAVTTYHLSYQDLKTMARAALDHSFLSFLQGASLWSAPDDFRAAAACASDQLGQPRPSQACQQLLDASPKAGAQWQQEAAFTRFEDHHQG